MEEWHIPRETTSECATDCNHRPLSDGVADTGKSRHISRVQKAPLLHRRNVPLLDTSTQRHICGYMCLPCDTTHITKPPRRSPSYFRDWRWQVLGNEASNAHSYTPTTKYKLNQLTVGGVSCQHLPSLGRAFHRSKRVTKRRQQYTNNC